MRSAADFIRPWQNKRQTEVSGSGFVISGKRILTNAHVVANQKLVLVRRHGLPDKFIATVSAVGHECDLAMLEVQDERFWSVPDLMPEMQLDNDPSDNYLPKLDDEIAVVGYPQGGDNISITRGVVSRVELQRYSHSGVDLLAIQIDAAINSGNSGGPAIRIGDDEEISVSGIAFQNLSGADNIGYIIPVPVVRHFLEDVRRFGKYMGFCAIGVEVQHMESEILRKFYKLPLSPDVPYNSGLLVQNVEPLATCKDDLLPGDVIVEIEGSQIANDGTVHFRERERISFKYMLTHKHFGDTVELKISRNGNIITKTVQLTLRSSLELVPSYEFDRHPSYFVFGGLVFMPLSLPYLEEWGEEWYNTAPRELVHIWYNELKKQENQQVVFLSQVLVHQMTQGYEDYANMRVLSVNGEEINNLQQLKDAVEKAVSNPPENNCLIFKFEQNRILVLDIDSAKQYSDEILDQHRVPSFKSRDLI
jgi:S1-C subfamily serine protease